MQSTKISSALLALTLVAALASPGSADATVYRDTSAGGACHAANGANAASFNFSNNYVTNTGTTTQYIICHLQMEDAFVPVATEFFAVHVQSTQAGTRIVSCSAQTGSFFNGVNQVKSAQVQAYTFSGPGSTDLNWNESTMARVSPWFTVTLNCRMDPGTRVGLIEYMTAEP